MTGSSAQGTQPVVNQRLPSQAGGSTPRTKPIAPSHDDPANESAEKAPDQTADMTSTTAVFGSDFERRPSLSVNTCARNHNDEGIGLDEHHPGVSSTATTPVENARQRTLAECGNQFEGAHDARPPTLDLEASE